MLGTLATIGEAPIDTELAGVIVIGAVVELATQIANEHLASAALTAKGS